MNLVDSMMGALKKTVAQIMPDGLIEDLIFVRNQILKGIGGNCYFYSSNTDINVES